ncbi:MAG: shikimate kinase [Anaerolineae bacterium]|jgi:shikimate kinase|nr:shikimate kinase [Anaerolineae bacterium]
MTADARNLILTGFMGTGKSAVGQRLAARLERPFLDMDTVIEHRTGLTIPRIFAEASEPFFRAMERGLCCELALQTQLVIATGGGALIDPFNYAALAKTGVIICLTADEASIEARLRESDARPLAGRWRELLAERQAVYAAMPHQVATGAKTIDQVVEEILILWQNVSRS